MFSNNELVTLVEEAIGRMHEENERNTIITSELMEMGIYGIQSERTARAAMKKLIAAGIFERAWVYRTNSAGIWTKMPGFRLIEKKEPVQ